jgi:polysaccharide biosynthesis transport protein
MSDRTIAPRRATSLKPPEPQEAAGPNLLLGALRRWQRAMWATFGVPLIVMGVLEVLPNQYTSRATLAVMQPQIPKQYVDQVAAGSSSDMIMAVTREVLSVTRLGGIVDRFNLYPSERGLMTDSQLGEELRKSIEVRPVDQASAKADYTAFSISYSNKDPKLAQQVLTQLTTLFVEVNLKDREAKAQSTTSFMKSQLEIAKQRLEEKEKVLANARVANASQNPTFDAGKLSLLSDLRMQLQLNAASATRLQQQRASIHASMLAGIARLESERASLLTQFTEQHPEVKKRTAEIDSYRRALASASADGSPARAVIADPVVADMKAQLDRTLVEIASLEADAKSLKSELAKFNQVILQSSPLTEQQLMLAQRDYDLLRQEFADLQSKYFRSELTSNLEQEQSGQSFRLVDPPTLPSTPSAPKRLRFSLIAVAVGLILGVVTAGLSEWRHPTYLTSKELTSVYSGIPLINVPIMLLPDEERSRRISRVRDVVVAIVGIMLVSAWEFRMFLYDTR